MSYEEQLVSLIRADSWRMRALENVRSLGLPDGWICAGFLRALVWDHLSGHTEATPLRDIDVVYYDPENMDEGSEKVFDQTLAAKMPGLPWSCKNQARMYLKYGIGEPYNSTKDGLRHFLETSAATAARLDDAGRIEILAPFGLEDLFNLRINPTPYAATHKMDVYKQLAVSKNWTQRWPKLVIGEI